MHYICIVTRKDIALVNAMDVVQQRLCPGPPPTPPPPPPPPPAFLRYNMRLLFFNVFLKFGVNVLS